MTNSRILSSLSLIGAALLLGACDGGGGPKIKSFEASQTALPEGGAEVTFTWDVSGEKSLTLNPYPGAVTGTSATVVVTEAQTFTLVAKKDGKKDTKKITFTVGEAFVVTGQAVDYYGRPAPGVQVFVDDQLFVTDPDGFFTAQNVVPPYDLGQIRTEGSGPAFGGPGELQVIVYQGVTRPDPVLLVNPNNPPENGYATVSGTVTGGAGFPPPPNHAADFDISVPSGGYNASFDGSSGAWDAELYWGNENLAQPFFVGVVQYDETSGIVYTGFGRHAGMANDDDSLTNVNIALSPVSTEDVTVTIDAPWTVSDAYAYPELTFGSVDGPEGAVLGGLPAFFPERYPLPSAYFTSAGTFALPVPGNVPGSGIAVYTNTYGPSGSGYAYHFDRTPGSSIDVTMPSIPTLLTPVEGGSITPATLFSVAPVEGAVYMHSFFADSFGLPAFGGPLPYIQILLFTNSSSLSFPEGLEDFGANLEGREIGWYATAAVGFGNVDGMLEDGGVPPGNAVYYTYEEETRYLIYGTRGGSKGPF